MKKTLIIVGGILFIILLIGVWVYLFIFGTPETVEDTIQNFPSSSSDTTSVGDGLDFSDQEESSDDSENNDEISQLNVSQSVVSQLSTEPVAGFTFRNDNEMLYVEAGTGHLYTVNLNNGEQRRLSNTTFTQTRKALFSPDSSVILLFANNEMKIALLEEDERLRIGSPIRTPKNIKIDDNNNILHTVSSDRSTSGFSTNTATGETETVFTIPLKDPVIVWGETKNSRHFTYPRPGEGLHGRLFEIQNNSLLFTPVSGENLTVVRHNNDFIFNHRVNSNLVSELWQGGNTTRSFTALEYPLYNEKCISVENILLCAKDQNNIQSINDWYKGVSSFNDGFWIVDTNQENIEEQINLEQATGRVIDVDMVTINQSGEKVLFRNKIDGNLWLYNSPEPLFSSPESENATD